MSKVGERAGGRVGGCWWVGWCMRARAAPNWRRPQRARCRKPLRTRTDWRTRARCEAAAHSFVGITPLRAASGRPQRATSRCTAADGLRAHLGGGGPEPTRAGRGKKHSRGPAPLAPHKTPCKCRAATRRAPWRRLRSFGLRQAGPLGVAELQWYGVRTPPPHRMSSRMDTNFRPTPNPIPTIQTAAIQGFPIPTKQTAAIQGGRSNPAGRWPPHRMSSRMDTNSGSAWRNTWGQGGAQQQEGEYPGVLPHAAASAWRTVRHSRMSKALAAGTKAIMIARLFVQRRSLRRGRLPTCDSSTCFRPLRPQAGAWNAMPRFRNASGCSACPPRARCSIGGCGVASGPRARVGKTA